MTQKIIVSVCTLALLIFVFFLCVNKKNMGRRIISTFCALLLLCSGACMPALTAFSVSEKGTVYRQQNFELYPDEGETEASVTLDGLMPKGASAEAVDVTEDASRLDLKADNQKNKEADIIFAYDITIKNGKKEYQPDEDKPIRVEITNPEIRSDITSELWHIKDDGTKEQIKDFSVEEGRVTFYARGFSIYALVNVRPPTQLENLTVLADLTGERAEEGFYLYYGADNYFSNSINGNNCFIETQSISSASVWYFEAAGSDYKIYTYVDGVEKYIHTKSENDIELSSTGDTFNITSTGTTGCFYFNKKDSNRYLQHSGTGGGIRYFTSNSNKTNCSIKIGFADSVDLSDDYCRLDGKTYGLMSYSGGTLGDALMAEGGSNYLDMLSLVVREDSVTKTLYVAEDSDISMWTFHNVSGNDYKISTEINGTTKYMKIDNNSLSLVDDISDASLINIQSNRNNKIKLTTADGNSITFLNNDTNHGFYVALSDDNDSKQWLNIVELSGLAQEDYVTYSADKVGVSDETVSDGCSVIVYTRVWDSERKVYDFYAVDYDGSLYPCYERGDSIMWIGHRINTLIWNFKEYKERDGSPNYYYELYNPYSRKYIAPKLSNGQTISDTKIGINLPGRRDEEYYTDIVAWDDSYYSYAGLKAHIYMGTNGEKKGEVITAKRAKADTFYFAMVETAVPTLTKVKTLDNNEYGISMKMVDFPKQPYKPDPSNPDYTVSLQNEFLGNSTYIASSPTQGLLSTNLNSSGYPTVANTASTYYGDSLYDLFSNSANKNYRTANHLFIESTYQSSGYFEFDSCQNFATLVQEDGTVGENFIVYKELGTTDEGNGKETLKHGQFLPYDTITAGVYSEKNPENLYTALSQPSKPTVGLLPDSDPRKNEKLHTIGKSTNYYNGMELSAGFIQTPSGKDAWGHDIIFEFTGDDDFWFYVDNELVIDLGGIHSALAGNVNFCTGEVVVQTDNNVMTRTYLSDLFESNYRQRNPNATDAEVNNYLAQFFDVDQNLSTDTETVYEKVFKDYSVHTMKIFYMERGAGASNLHMRFNLSYVTPGNVMLTKETIGTRDLDFDLVEYPYQIWYAERENPSASDWKLLSNNDEHGNYEEDKVTYMNSTQRVRFEESYLPPRGTTPYASVYFLHPGRNAEIHFPSVAVMYKVVECGVNTDVYQEVKINGGQSNENILGSTGRASYESDEYHVKQDPTIVYQNNVDPDFLRTLRFSKKLYDESGNELFYDLGSGMTADQQDRTTFNYRLYLSNGADDKLKLADMYEYHVKNPEGKYCRWDVANQCFAATNITNLKSSSLTEEDIDSVTFETSMNGSISKIPARYVVEVPYLPAGMKFEIEERENEIPLGYSFMEYVCENNSYETDGGNNIGWIGITDTPDMTVKNKRGFGLEANKVWSDSDFTSWHNSIYTAVFIGDSLTPVANTVKKIDDPDTYVRYFFDSLEEGKDISDYIIQEVELTDPVFDSSGNLTGYGAVSRVIDGDPLVIRATPVRTNVQEDLSYVARYTQGTVSKTASGASSSGNVRTDTIENRRSGGLVISLYDMETGEPLADGDFVIKRKNIERITDGNGNVISTTTTTTTLGTFTSNSFGRITVLYDFASNASDSPNETVEEYTITQVGTPQSYIAVPNTTTFFIFKDDPNNVKSVNVSVSGNESVEDTWENGYKNTVQGDELVAYIDLFNKQFVLKAEKRDSVTNTALSGAKFALYRSVKGIGGELKDVRPAPGYEELVSDANGVIPQIDNTLPEGKYYLTEISPPANYEELGEDIIFTVSDGYVTINSAGHQGYLSLVTANSNTYTITIPNTRIPSGSNELKLSHKVDADDVNPGLKLETLGVANRDVFEVKMGTKDMGAGEDNDVTIPINHDFSRRSPNYTYIEGEIYYPDHLRYAAQTPITSLTQKIDVLQLRKENWEPDESEKKNSASSGSGYTDITAYYEWTDTSKQLDLSGEPLQPEFYSAENEKGVGIPHGGIVDLLYDQTAIFRNQFPADPVSAGTVPTIAFQLKENLQAFKNTNDSTTGLIDIYNDVVGGVEEKPPLERKHSEFYTASIALTGGEYTGDTVSNGGYSAQSNAETAASYGGGEFKVISEDISIEYTHKIKTGSFTVSKELDGTVSDKDSQGRKKDYTFIVSYKNLFGCHNPDSTLDKEAWTYADGITGILSGEDAYGHSYSDTAYYADDDARTVTAQNGGRFTLSEGASVTFTGIPVGTVLRVEELSEFIEPDGMRTESYVNRTVFSGVVGEGGLSADKIRDYTGENEKNDLMLDRKQIKDGSETKTKTTVNTGGYQMTDGADWLYEIHNTYTRIPVLYRYIDRYVENGKATDLRDGYTYFVKDSNTGYSGISSGGELSGALKTAVCDSAPNIVNVLCSYNIKYDAASTTDGVYYENQNTFYRNTVKEPSGVSHSQFELLDVTAQLNAVLNAMYGSNDSSTSISETAYEKLKDDCSSVLSDAETPQVYAKNDVMGFKASLRSIINKAIKDYGTTPPTKAQLIEKLKSTDGVNGYFYYDNGSFKVVQATYANALRLYDVNLQLIVPNAMHPAAHTLTEQRTINVNSDSYHTGEYITIKYKVPFNGISNLAKTANADGDINIGIINSLGLSDDCKELYHIHTADGRELYFGYWERIITYNDGNTLKTTFSPVSTNFNYRYRVNDHVTIRAVYQEADKGSAESNDNRRRYDPGKTFDEENEFIPFDKDAERTIERLYTPVQERTRVIFWQRENGVKKYMDNNGEYTIPESIINGLEKPADRFYKETYDAKYGTDAVNIKIQIENWHNASVNDTGSHLTVTGETTASSYIGSEQELYQVSYMVPNENEQVGYAASATDRTYNNYSVQTASGIQNRTRVDVVFGGVGSADSDTDIEEIGYVLFQSPKTGENAKYGNASEFHDALTAGGSLRSTLENTSVMLASSGKYKITNDTSFGAYNVRMSMNKVTMHDGSGEAGNANGAVLTNKNRVNIVFDMPNNENTKKSFYTCYTVIKIKDNNGNYLYRISDTPVTFNLNDADSVTENEGHKTYFMNISNGTATPQEVPPESEPYAFDDNVNPEVGYLASNYTTAVEGRKLVFTPHFLDKTEDGVRYSGRFVKVEIGKTEFTAEQLEQLNNRQDVEIIFDPSVYLNDPLSEGSFHIKVYMEKIKQCASFSFTKKAHTTVNVDIYDVNGNRMTKCCTSLASENEDNDAVLEVPYNCRMKLTVIPDTGYTPDTSEIPAGLIDGTVAVGGTVDGDGEQLWIVEISAGNELQKNNDVLIQKYQSLFDNLPKAKAA